MEEKAFLEKYPTPDDARLRSALGPAFRHYAALTAVASSFAQDWAYTKSGGWMLKAGDGKKALFYLIPLKGSLKVSLAVRENEKSSLARNSDLETVRTIIEGARKVAEGYAMQFLVPDAKACRAVTTLLEALIELRT